MRAREFIGESVDLEAIHAEALNEHLIDNPHLYEGREDYQTMRQFLDINKTDAPVVGNFYAYTNVNSTPMADFTVISHFNEERQLVKIQNDVAYFDVNGEIRRFPEKGTLTGDALSQIYFFDSTNDVENFVTTLRLRFPTFKIKLKALDDNRSIIESKPVERNGIKLDTYMDGVTVEIHAMDGNTRIGYVVFDRDGKDLTPIDLAVERDYQRRGVASTMYDHAKDLGFKIHASSDQTSAGKQFWNKHRGKERVWENAVNKVLLTNNMRANEFISEGASSVLYHYTSTQGAYNILSSGEFKLASVTGTKTEQQYAPEGYDYFLSTTRTRVGDYHKWVGSSAVMFVLDGNWFGQRYPVKPIDYWDRAWLHAPDRTREAEDRVFSKSPSIPIGGVRQVHVLLTEQQEYRSPMTRKLLILAKKQGIEAFFYTDKKAWLLQDTRKAISPEEAKGVLSGQEPTKSHRDPLGYLSPWIELIHKNKKSQLSDKAVKLRYNLVYYGGDAGLANDMSNARKPGNDGYENAIKINDYMRQNRFKSLGDLVEALKRKWKDITD